MRALYLHTIATKLLSPVGIVLLLIGPVTIAVTAFLSPLDAGGAALQASLLTSGLAAIIFGAGLLGQPLASGEMITWLTRPLSLPAILLARFGGALTATLVVALAPVVLALPFGGGVDLTTLLQSLAGATAILATIAFLSCLLPGYGDVVVALLLLIAAGIARDVLVPLVPWLHWPVTVLARVVGNDSRSFLDVLVRPELTTARDAAFGLFRITALLATGAFILTRRDFGYGRG